MNLKLEKIDEILQKNLSKDDKLYGIFDGAIIENLWVNIEAWEIRTKPLFRGDYEKIAEAIPYVIELDYDKDQLAYETLLEEVGKNAILFISSNLGLEALTEKMQYFYHIRTSSGESALRRFYDPRIFPNFIAGMNAQNKLLFFRYISFYFSEYEHGTKLISFNKKGDELVRETHSLIDNDDDKKKAL